MHDVAFFLTRCIFHAIKEVYIVRIRVNFYNINACYENTTCPINLVCILKTHKNKVVEFHCLFNACSTWKMLILTQFINFVKRFYILRKNMRFQNLLEVRKYIEHWISLSLSFSLYSIWLYICKHILHIYSYMFMHTKKEIFINL